MKKSVVMFVAAVLLCLCGCSKKSEAQAAQSQQSPFQSQFNVSAEEETFTKEAKLCDLAQKYNFKVGACISYNQLNRSGYIKMLTEDFNTTTATNEFKAYSLLDQKKSIEAGKPMMNYAQADSIARMAQEKGIGIRGHVLVWDAYMTEWFFREGFRGDGMIVGKEEMESRVKSYIEDVVTHFETAFPGVVY